MNSEINVGISFRITRSESAWCIYSVRYTERLLFKKYLLFVKRWWVQKKNWNSKRKINYRTDAVCAPYVYICMMRLVFIPKGVAADPRLFLRRKTSPPTLVFGRRIASKIHGLIHEDSESFLPILISFSHTLVYSPTRQLIKPRRANFVPGLGSLLFFCFIGQQAAHPSIDFFEFNLLRQSSTPPSEYTHCSFSHSLDVYRKIDFRQWTRKNQFDARKLFCGMREWISRADAFDWISPIICTIFNNDLHYTLHFFSVTAIMAHFCFLATFFWLNTMCFNIWWTFRLVKRGDSTSLFILFPALLLPYPRPIKAIRIYTPRVESLYRSILQLRESRRGCGNNAAEIGCAKRSPTHAASFSIIGTSADWKKMFGEG